MFTLGFNVALGLGVGLFVAEDVELEVGVVYVIHSLKKATAASSLRPFSLIWEVALSQSQTVVEEALHAFFSVLHMYSVIVVISGVGSCGKS